MREEKYSKREIDYKATVVRSTFNFLSHDCLQCNSVFTSDDGCTKFANSAIAPSFCESFPSLHRTATSRRSPYLQNVLSSHKPNPEHASTLVKQGSKVSEAMCGLHTCLHCMRSLLGGVKDGRWKQHLVKPHCCIQPKGALGNEATSLNF